MISAGAGYGPIARLLPRAIGWDPPAGAPSPSVTRERARAGLASAAHPEPVPRHEFGDERGLFPAVGFDVRQFDVLVTADQIG